KPPVYQATRWEPVEVSLCAVPADAGAQVRSTDDGVRYPRNVTGRTFAMDSTPDEPPTRRKGRAPRSEERPPGPPEPDESDTKGGDEEQPVPPPVPDKEDAAADAALAE